MSEKDLNVVTAGYSFGGDQRCAVPGGSYHDGLVIAKA